MRHAHAATSALCLRCSSPCCRPTACVRQTQEVTADGRCCVRYSMALRFSTACSSLEPPSRPPLAARLYSTSTSTSTAQHSTAQQVHAAPPRWPRACARPRPALGLPAVCLHCTAEQFMRPPTLPHGPRVCAPLQPAPAPGCPLGTRLHITAQHSTAGSRTIPTLPTGPHAATCRTDTPAAERRASALAMLGWAQACSHQPLGTTPAMCRMAMAQNVAACAPMSTRSGLPDVPSRQSRTWEDPSDVQDGHAPRVPPRACPAVPRLLRAHLQRAAVLAQHN